MNDDTHPANMDVKRLAPSTASLAGVLSLGAGFMSPAFAVVPPADCVLGQAVTTGSCKLDVNGGGADLTVGVFGTTQSQGYLSAYNSSPMSFLLGSAVVGKPALLKLSAGDSVEASDFVSGASGSGGVPIWQAPPALSASAWRPLAAASTTAGSSWRTAA